MVNYLYIVGTILFTVYGQLVLKWQVSRAGDLPTAALQKCLFLSRLLCNPWIISGLAGAFVASLCWMAAMAKFQLSHAYPFTSLGFVLVVVMSAVLFGEAITVSKAVGVALITAGVIVGSQG